MIVVSAQVEEWHAVQTLPAEIHQSRNADGRFHLDYRRQQQRRILYKVR